MDGIKSWLEDKKYYWILWIVFFTSNLFLSYGSFSYLVKGWIFFTGVFSPLIIFLIISKKNKSKNFLLRDPIAKPIRPSVWIVLIIVAIYLRFFKLTSLYVWPVGDEGLNGLFAVDLAKIWKWHFFYTCGQLPPFLTWVLGFLFKFSSNAFLNMWIVPALVSTLTVFLGYGAARKYFSASFALICGCLLGFGFWPLYIGRFCHQGMLVPCWVCGVLFFLASFLKSSAGKPKQRMAIYLGLCAGLGSFTFTPWPVVIVAVVTAVSFSVKTKILNLKNFKIWLSFFLALTFALMPFGIAAFQSNYGGHLWGVSSLTGWFSLGQQFLTSLSYLTVLFWGSLQKNISYGPLWGGMLNPILGASFGVGLVELFRFRSLAFVRWLAFTFFLCLLPGLLSADYVEMFRISQVMPFALLIAAIGIQSLLNQTKLAFRGLVLGLILSFSFGLDFYHFLLPGLTLGPGYKISFKTETPDENFEAYQVLKTANQNYGPGLIFSDFLLLSHNHTLEVMTYPFNDALLPNADLENAKWAGLIVNINYQPFLQKRFPESKWYPVTPQPTVDGGLVVGIVPITLDNQSVFERWKKAHDYFHELNIQAESIMNNKDLYESALEHLPEGYSLVLGDPFLESCFGEWLAQYHYGPDYQMNVLALQRAIHKGYPSANLYYKLGNFLVINGEPEEARVAYEKAVHSKSNYTNAADSILYVDQVIQSKKK